MIIDVNKLKNTNDILLQCKVHCVIVGYVNIMLQSMHVKIKYRLVITNLRIIIFLFVSQNKKNKRS